MNNQKTEKLNRFTQFPNLVELLLSKKLVFSDPSHWEDQNDIASIKFYETQKHCKLRLLCFCQAEETLHHWKTYAAGPYGCCIEFDKLTLLQDFQKFSNVLTQEVTYKRIKDLSTQGNTIKIDQYPFLKRKPYECDSEFRIIWRKTDAVDNEPTEVDLNLNCINRITLNSQIPTIFVHLLKKLIKDSNLEINVNISTIYKNTTWINKLKNLNHPPIDTCT
ncbi:MAG: hypothetical protein A9181_00820 [Dehalococcoides mccartyi]|nr:MAG: hypothetical protein A9181_00820 [Dehalococcoides mccartyi]